MSLYSSRSEWIQIFFPFWLLKSTFPFREAFQIWWVILFFRFVFVSWNIEIDRREWAHRGTWYSHTLLLLRAHFSFCQLPVLEITSNLALLCSNSHQTNPNSTPHTTSTQQQQHRHPCLTTESVTFDSVAEPSPSSTVQVN